MFDNPAAGESAGIMSMIPALLQNKGLDHNMVAALMSNKNNQDAWGGAGCWWIWIILLFFLWGGNGFGNGFGNGANGIPAQLNNEAGRELLMNAIQGNGTAINQLASSLNCSTHLYKTIVLLVVHDFCSRPKRVHGSTWIKVKFTQCVYNFFRCVPFIGTIRRSFKSCIHFFYVLSVIYFSFNETFLLPLYFPSFHHQDVHQ